MKRGAYGEQQAPLEAVSRRQGECAINGFLMATDHLLLCGIIIGEQMLMISKNYKVAMTVHDAIMCVVPEAEVLQAQEYVELCMRLRPQWAQELPLNCESGFGFNYGEC